VFKRVRERPVVEEFLRRRVEKGAVLRKLKEQVFKATTEILDPDRFYARLKEDLANAKYEVIIYSPFTFAKRVEWLIATKELQDAVARGVSVKAIVKDPDEFKKPKDREAHRDNIKKLVDAGIEVYTRPKMHYKAVVVDREVIYLGSYLRCITRLWLWIGK